MNAPRPLPKLTTALLAATVLAACGGSSGSADGAPPAPPAPAVCDDQSASRVPARVDEQIGIDAAANLGPAAPLIGFNHGIAAPSGPDADFHPEAAARITALKPGLWRVSDARHYAKAKALGAQQIMYMSADALFGYQPVYYPWTDTGTGSGSFDNWARFDANAASLLQRSLAPGQGVDYWGVLNEPPVLQYTDAERQLLLETYKHGWHNFKNGHPEQKVVGPSSVGFSALLIQSFLDYAVAQNLKYDAIDWHEIGTRPEDVVAHTNEVRAMVAARPGLGTPVITISEYGSTPHHLLPGFSVAWFHYLEKAAVKIAARTCWNVTDPANGLWSTCWDGLNGLFMKDNRTPQALYWVFERYAQMLGRTLATTSTAPADVVALARNTSSDAAAAGTTKVLLGRFVSDSGQAPAATKSIAVHLQGLPAATTCARIEIQRIPHLGPDVQSGPDPTAQPLQNVEVVDRYTAKVVGGKVSAYLPAFKDRDAYYLSVD